LEKELGGSTVPVTHWKDIAILTEAISRIGVDNGYPVLGGTPVAWEPAQDDWNIGAIATPENGHVFVWGDEWVTYDSEWTGHPDYQVERFWQNALKWLSPDKVCQIAISQIN
jgi:hypothetical protein